MSYPQPDIIGVWLLKWVVAPVLVIGVVGWLIQFEVMKYKCRKIAEERGYIESTYIPPDRLGFGERCICRRKLNPDGSVDETAKLRINLDE
jgi:hypothetical protein